MRKQLLATLIGFVIVLAACGTTPEVSTTRSNGTDPTTTSTPATNVVDDDGDEPGTVNLPADQIVIQVFNQPGFTSVDYALRAHPHLVVYGDGRIVRAVQSDDLQLVPKIETAQLDVGEIVTFLDDVKTAGVLEDGTDFGQIMIADAGATELSAWIDGKLESVAVEALSFEGAVDGATGVENRKTLQGLVERVTVLGTDLEFEEGTAASYEVFAIEWFAQNGGPDRPQLIWPLENELLAAPADGGYASVALTGADLTAVLAIAEGGDAWSPWDVGGDEPKMLVLRPLFG